MWAFRSFLRRPNALITSRLRPIHGHHAVLGRNLITASRRRFSDATNGDPHQPAAATKRHLYLVLDDHKKDYGIYKLDVDADLLDGEVGSDSATALPRLPHPALIRLDVPEDEDQSTQFAAAGSCIVATSCSHLRSLVYSGDYGIVTMLYDVKTAALSVSTHPTDTLHFGYEVAVPVGNRLYVLDSYSSTEDSFHCMTTSKDGDDDGAADGEVKQRKWSWYEDSGSSRIGWTYGGKARSWSDELPFSPDDIQGYAVHPRRCTIYVSARMSYERRYCVDTFAYDTTSAGCWDWTRCDGRWELPFKGHARYDGELNMWVGLQVDEEAKGTETTGYLCACGLPSSEDGPPESKRVGSMEKILPDDPDRRRVDFKLVYMGERGEYCLFERLRRDGADEKKRLGDDGEECVLRLTTFRLKYERGEPDYLRIVDRLTRSYKVSRYREDFEAHSFWI